MKVFEALAIPVADPLRQPSYVRSKLRELARDHVSYAVSLKVANSFRQRFGNIDILPKGVDGKSLGELLALLEGKRFSEVSRCSSSLGAADIETACKAEHQRIDDALNQDNDDWKALVPGRPILKRFASFLKQEYVTLKRLYIREAKTTNPSPFKEIEQIFASFQATS